MSERLFKYIGNSYGHHIKYVLFKGRKEICRIDSEGNITKARANFNWMTEMPFWRQVPISDEFKSYIL
jgi:hypothetical protein